MESIVETVLRLPRAEQGARTFQPQSVDLVEYFENILPQYEKLLSRKIDTQFSSPHISAYIDPNLFGLIVSNLFRNIAKHTSDEVKVGVEVTELSPSRVEVKVLDEGEGLPKDADQKGLGLQLCKQIAEVSGIELAFTNREFRGLEVKMGLSKLSS
jgi:signal transduction histidine kinase